MRIKNSKKSLKPPKATSSGLGCPVPEVQEQLRIAQLSFEKCDFAESQQTYENAYHKACLLSDVQGMMESAAGLVQLAALSADCENIADCEKILDACIAKFPKQIPPMVWYCKGALARQELPLRKAQRYFHRYLRAGKTLKDESIQAKGWAMLTVVQFQKDDFKRAKWLGLRVLSQFGDKNYRGINGTLYLLMGRLAEQERNLEEALSYYQKAHASFLSEHHWYYHLHVLAAYARVSRLQKNYVQAYWYLDLVKRACQGNGFGLILRGVERERSLLEQDAVDLLIDSRRGLVRTRESSQIPLGKQWVLLNILEALWSAHSREGNDDERGLSKAEIIEQVWNESYRPEAHDNKLYYNINRLRKLIEPDQKQPRYLVSWKEGYRLAPGLRVEFLGSVRSGVMGELEGEVQ
ncbi:helix-turn-helix domain-containing protein [Bdellovibrionota bacterium FG-2]